MEQRRNHKYIARVQDGANKFKYFYTQSELAAYKAGKSVGSTAKKAAYKVNTVGSNAVGKVKDFTDRKVTGKYYQKLAAQSRHKATMARNSAKDYDSSREYRTPTSDGDSYLDYSDVSAKRKSAKESLKVGGKMMFRAKLAKNPKDKKEYLEDAKSNLKYVKDVKKGIKDRSDKYSEYMEDANNLENLANYADANYNKSLAGRIKKAPSKVKNALSKIGDKTVTAAKNISKTARYTVDELVDRTSDFVDEKITGSNAKGNANFYRRAAIETRKEEYGARYRSNLARSKGESLKYDNGNPVIGSDSWYKEGSDYFDQQHKRYARQYGNSLAGRVNRVSRKLKPRKRKK